MQDQIVVKVIVVGDVGVGKTSLLTQYCFEQFDPHQSPTIGCDFSTKVVKKNGNPLKLQLWDVAGQEKFQSLSKLFIRGAQGCLVVTDITNNDSLDNAILWKELVANEVTDIPIFLIQNKTDLVSRSQSVLCLESLQNIGQNYNFLKWFQISAKNGENVGIMFYELVDAMVEKGTLKLDENVIKSSFSLRNHSQTKSNSELNKKCC